MKKVTHNHSSASGQLAVSIYSNCFCSNAIRPIFKWKVSQGRYTLKNQKYRHLKKELFHKVCTKMYNVLAEKQYSINYIKMLTKIPQNCQHINRKYWFNCVHKIHYVLWGRSIKPKLPAIFFTGHFRVRQPRTKPPGNCGVVLCSWLSGKARRALHNLNIN